MGEQKNVVVINGKTFDSVSGELVNASKEAVPISDFKRPETHHQATTQVQPHSRSHHQPHHVNHHKQQKSVTLKRAPKTAVASIHNSKSTPVASKEITTAQTEQSLPNSQSRLDRAKQVSRSTAISRFNPVTHTVESRQEPLSVQPTPIHSRELSSAQSMPTLTQDTADEDIFNQALSRAESHKQAPHKPGRRHRLANKLGIKPKVANALAGVLVVVILGGFIAYQNAPYISLKLAANRSGLASASLPGYKPSGFALNRHIGASPGQITINFHSNSDERAFTITQSSSNWDSQTLADSYLANKQAQRVDQDNGKTVYVYGSNATWVDGGMWYRIEGNSALTNDQLLKIANSF